MDLFRYREKHTPADRGCVDHQQRVNAATKFGVVSFYRLGNFICYGRIIPTIFGKGWGFPGFGPPPTPWSFKSTLELSWHLRVWHFSCWLRIKVWSCLPSWSHLILIGLCCVLGLCHSSEFVPCSFLSCYRSSWFIYYWSIAWRILSITLLTWEINAIVW